MGLMIFVLIYFHKNVKKRHWECRASRKKEKRDREPFKKSQAYKMHRDGIPNQSSDFRFVNPSKTDAGNIAVHRPWLEPAD